MIIKGDALKSTVQDEVHYHAGPQNSATLQSNTTDNKNSVTIPETLDGKWVK